MTIYYLQTADESVKIPLGQDPLHVRYGMRIAEDPHSDPHARLRTSWNLVIGRSNRPARLYEDISWLRNRVLDALKQAQEAINDGYRERFIWLYRQVPSQRTGVTQWVWARQLIYGGQMVATGGNHSTPIGNTDKPLPLQLILEHGARMEQVTEETLTTYTRMRTDGGTLYLPVSSGESAFGANGRLSEIIITPEAGGQSHTELWLGIHPRQQSGTFFARSTARRTNIGFTQIYSVLSDFNSSFDLSAYRGQFRLLAQVRTSSLTKLTAGVGTTSGNSLYRVENEPVFVNTNNRWLAVDFGEITLPPWGRTASYNLNEWRTVTVFMEGISTSNLARWILLPSKHMLHIKGLDIREPGIIPEGQIGADSYFSLTETGELMVRNYTGNQSTQVNTLVQSSPNNWEMPRQGGDLVLVTNNSGQSTLYGEFNVTVKQVPRGYAL